MKKLGILLDSFSGYSQKELKKMGIEYINQMTIVDDISYNDGIDLELKDPKAIKIIEEGTNIKSSMPAVGLVMEKIEKMSKEYENVIYFTMNKGVSSTYSTGVAAASEFNNVKVIANKMISSAQTDSCIKAMDMAEKGSSMEEILEFFRDMSKDSYGYVIPKDVQGLIRSGRVKGPKKVILEKAKLIPGLLVTDDGFKVDSTKRNFNKIIKKIVEKIISSVGEENIDKYNWEVIHTGDETTKNKVTLIFKEYGITNFRENWASLTIAAHTGIGAVGISVWKKVI